MGLLLAVAMVIALSGGAMADGAMYDHDIQFSGHTFGETFLTARESIQIDSIDFEFGRRLAYSRVLADPGAYPLGGSLGIVTDIPYAFAVDIKERPVAGLRAFPTMYFLFSSQEAARDFDLDSAVFYGATYDFYEGTASGQYQDLKRKLISVYGEPFAENADFDEVFGPLISMRTDTQQEAIDQVYQDYTDSVSPITYAAWKSSTNGGLIVLVNYCENGDYERTRVHYFDLSMDNTVAGMYSEAGEFVDPSENVDGL